MGHVNYQSLEVMVRRGDIAFELISHDKPTCPDCVKGKASRQPIPKVRLRNSESVGDLIHSDIWGPAPITSIGGMRYFVTFIDDYCRFTTVVPIQKKPDVFVAFHGFNAHLLTQNSISIKRIRTDGGRVRVRL
jgi:hypothetical protein